MSVTDKASQTGRRSEGLVYEGSALRGCRTQESVPEDDTVSPAHAKPWLTVALAQR